MMFLYSKDDQEYGKAYGTSHSSIVCFVKETIESSIDMTSKGCFFLLGEFDSNMF